MAAAGRPPKNLHHAESEPAFAAILDGNFSKLVVVDFFATWCGPCKMYAPLFEAMARRHPDAVFVKVDSDKCNALASRYAVRALPTTILLLKGNKVASVQGARDAEVSAAIEANKPVAGTALSWGGPEPAAGEAVPASGGGGGGSLTPFSGLSSEDQAKADSILSVTACTRAVAAAVLQKHKGDVDAATMDVLTDRAGCEAFAAENMPSAAGSAAPAAGSAASAAASAALGHTAGEAGEGAAVPDPKGGAALQFRLDGRATVRTKETFAKTATVGAVGEWLRSKLPVGATFTLMTRKGASAVPLDPALTLEAAGLAPRGLVLVHDCAAVAFL